LIALGGMYKLGNGRSKESMYILGSGGSSGVSIALCLQYGAFYFVPV